MQVLGTALGRDLHKIATGITLRVWRVNSAGSMEWLMDITNVVNEQTNGIREAFLLSEGWKLFLHGGVNETALVAPWVRDPLLKRGNRLINGVGIRLEEGVIFLAASLVEVGNVNEVPARLPWSALGLDFISECSTFHKGIVAFQSCHWWVRAAIDLEEGVSLSKSNLTLAGWLKLIEGNFGH